MKTGKHHIDSLRDGRTVYLNGEAVTDVVDHPAYRHAIQSVAHLYDPQAAGVAWGEYFVPNKRMLYASLVLTQTLYPQVLNTVRELAGGGLMMLPSSAADFANSEIAPYIYKTQQSPVVDATDRVKLFKLAWDAVGSEFASRHQQYEMFYASAAFVTRGHAFRTCDWEGATGLVDDLLSRYDLPEVAP
jgi:4-hydroxyphenylacetate 3-monooxygenase